MTQTIDTNATRLTTPTVADLVAVKPLEWKSAGYDGQSLEASALGLEVCFRVHGKPGDWTLTSPGAREYVHTPGYETRADATAAAQTDFERRIFAALSPAATEPVGVSTPITMTYRNYRGEVDQRTVLPTRLWFGSTDWHPEPGWLMSAYDLGKAAHRDFALADCQFADLALPSPVTVEEAARETALKIMQMEVETFCRRVEAGEICSKRTYAAFKDCLRALAVEKS